MARELSQEAVLDFLWGAGGRAPNTALLRHFQRFLRDPALTEQQRRERREYFKSLVNSLATVHPATAPGASKDIVLRRRYRDLLDEELPPPQEQQEEEEKEPPPPPRRDPDRRRAPRGEAAEKGRPGDGQPPGVSVAGGCAARGRGGPCCECRRARRAAAPPPYRTRPLGAWALHPHGPPHSRSPALPSGPGALTRAGPPPYQTLQPPAGRPSRSRSPPLPPGPGPPPSQSPPQSLTQAPPSWSLQPPPAGPPLSQSLLPAQGLVGPQAPESSPRAPLPVFRSIRCQLAWLEVQGIPPSLPDDNRQQPRIMPSKSCPRNVPSRGLSVPLGQREHAWLVAVSAGRWAQVRGLFLEDPELALQRDFMSGFTVLHWLAKHGDGPGLQELAAAARQAGLALDVDARSGCGYTPLHLAAIHGHQLVIKVLVLQLGCQVQVRDSNGRRPWEYLGSSTSGEIWQLLEAPRGTIMFPTQPLARSVSSASKVSLSAGRAALPACLRPQHGRGAASHRTLSESD
ncbi:ankyrin repeat domain-containing protein SOWAHB [Chroicocephalus ridibundus]|uniref:ankyrin repeat domain-containing protein SOWAHB n=1 Tax=Chroicocephalus ridibundus TaxID=1192867 RepID=UPI002FDDEBDE